MKASVRIATISVAFLVCLCPAPYAGVRHLRLEFAGGGAFIGNAPITDNMNRLRLGDREYDGGKRCLGLFVGTDVGRRVTAGVLFYALTGATAEGHRSDALYVENVLDTTPTSQMISQTYTRRGLFVDGRLAAVSRERTELRMGLAVGRLYYSFQVLEVRSPIARPGWAMGLGSQERTPVKWAALIHCDASRSLFRRVAVFARLGFLLAPEVTFAATEIEEELILSASKRLVVPMQVPELKLKAAHPFLAVGLSVSLL